MRASTRVRVSLLPVVVSRGTPAIGSRLAPPSCAPADTTPTLAPPPQPHAGIRLADVCAREVVDDIFAHALKKQTGVSLKYMLDFGSNPIERQLVLSSQFSRNARRIQASPTDGQTLTPPVLIQRAIRLH